MLRSETMKLFLKTGASALKLFKILKMGDLSNIIAKTGEAQHLFKFPARIDIAID